VSTEISKVRKHAMLLVQTLVQPRVDVQKVKNNFASIIPAGISEQIMATTNFDQTSMHGKIKSVITHYKVAPPPT
jgi:hypothetical protein